MDLFVIIFINDIFICSYNKEYHVTHRIVVLQTLKDHRLFAKFYKYGFSLYIGSLSFFMWYLEKGYKWILRILRHYNICPDLPLEHV